MYDTLARTMRKENEKGRTARRHQTQQMTYTLAIFNGETMRHEIQLPVQITVDDYHEFSSLQKHLKLLSKNIKVKEIVMDGGMYHGIAYIDKLTDPENALLIEKIKEKAEE